MNELRCIECGAASSDGRGWRAEIAIDILGDDADEVEVYCADCWEREFGEALEERLAREAARAASLEETAVTGSLLGQ